MWPIYYKVLSTMLRLIPSRLRFMLWSKIHARGRQRWQYEGLAQRVEGGMYIKMSNLVRPSEGAATNFVRRNTNIPVPIVIDNVTVDGVTALVLSRVSGTPLIHFRNATTPAQSLKVAKQLSAYLAQLRSLPAPSQGVCGFDGTAVRCERIAMGSKPRGPWQSVSAFHSDLVQYARLDIPPDMADAVQSQIRLAHSRSHRVCLTHNDLGPQNIMVDEDFNITAIIDWEAAAWMPEYWEYTKATFLPWNRKGWWFDIMTAVFPVYEAERQAEAYILQYREIYT